jgi:DNA-binding GntR family transcriptional regulator
MAESFPSNAKRGNRGTLTERAYQALRRDIIDGIFAPCQPLRLESLKERYGLSFSPLREALNRLHSEKLVLSTAQRGFRVAELSRQEMWDTIETRILIECEALRRAMKNGQDDWETQMVAAFYSLSLCAERYPMTSGEASAAEAEELEARHRVFHCSLIAASDSQSLLHLAAQLYDQTERYRRPLLSTQRRFDQRDFQAEHKTIMDAVMARDPAATDLLAAHYRQTGTAIESALARLKTEAA